MLDKRELLFTTGEFAKLCATTKETLFHYDETGVLKPAKTGENGYRYYASTQFFDFDLIAMLREAGCSLKEIRAHFINRTPQSFSRLLEDNEKKLLLEKQKLEKMCEMLSNARQAIEQGLQGQPGLPWLETVPTELFIATPARGDVLELPNVVASIQDHIRYCEDRQLGAELAVGSIVTKEGLLKEDYRESFYSTQLQSHGLPLPKALKQEPRLHRKPSGRYATLLHRGDYSTLPHSYALLIAWMEGQQLAIGGNAYETDLVGYLATDKVEDYILKLSIETAPLTPSSP